MARLPQTVFTCQNCGRTSRKWLGQCPDCSEWNSFVEELYRSEAISIPNRFGGSSRVRSLGEIAPQDESRTASGIAELDRVLGGGIVPGSLVLIGGAPGIGKSTLVLQAAENLCTLGSPVLYVSGEESEKQIKMRGERLGVSAKNLFVLAETSLEIIFSRIAEVSPAVLIIDSVQTIFSESIQSAPGSVSQVREVAAKLMIYAKQTGTPVFLTGHITKDGSIAGPKTLEHIVDTVLYFEGDRHHNHRIIRAAKNRFGAANEIGVFEMTDRGLIPVANPSELFLQERPENAAGSVVTVCIEGTRPVLVEVQALVGGSRLGTGRRMTQGFDHNRASLLIAVLEKRLGYQLSGDDVFVNIAGGIEIDEPAADLGVAAAVASSLRNIAIFPKTAVFGEIGLTGEIRGVSQAYNRAREAKQLGFKRLIVPESNLKGLERLLGIRIIGVRNLDDALEAVFSNAAAA
ncbi:MAG: DNA repair protein RadA [Blastocatellia bacterium]